MNHFMLFSKSSVHFLFANLKKQFNDRCGVYYEMMTKECWWF